MTKSAITKDLNDLLNNAVKETGASLKNGVAAVATYTAERAAHLATIADEPGFDKAVRAERDSVALFAGITAVKNAKAADARIIGIIHAGLLIGARLVAVA